VDYRAPGRALDPVGLQAAPEAQRPVEDPDGLVVHDEALPLGGGRLDHGRPRVPVQDAHERLERLRMGPRATEIHDERVRVRIPGSDPDRPPRLQRRKRLLFGGGQDQRVPRRDLHHPRSRVREAGERGLVRHVDPQKPPVAVPQREPGQRPDHSQRQQNSAERPEARGPAARRPSRHGTLLKSGCDVVRTASAGFILPRTRPDPDERAGSDPRARRRGSGAPAGTNATAPPPPA